ncbi:hypothetical protein [Haloquadratum walsbyi]|uniref:Uncharacterized protein n=1 Tax=Haloquadratum walsbyi J07HQW2 TaxID=1238425 RepID=U1MZE6_9EURY|nr:hypothetical protein [Haloquadratum walsbyi]ERG95869.1 MAG: hypothetical protein J07HQW2_02329 [Haloquadratum walsbyi J07HQW2]
MTGEDGDHIIVEYVGRFADGTEFSTSRQEVSMQNELAAEGDELLAFIIDVGETIDRILDCTLRLKINIMMTLLPFMMILLSLILITNSLEKYFISS